MVALFNPEQEWERATELQTVDFAEVERRVGPTGEPMTLLSGGLANWNVRVGDAKVVRIHRRDASATRKEERLLTYRWNSFIVPPVHAAGDDYLVLGYVAHRLLEDSAEHGARVGRALAEIHAVAQARAMELGLGAGVVRGDALSQMVEYVKVQVANGGPWTAMLERILRLVANKEEEFRASAPIVLNHGDFKVSNLKWTERGLLVLDWEFAYLGPSLMDVGQLLRWRPSHDFVESFAASYRAGGGHLSEAWQRWAAAFDLFNLAYLIVGSKPESRKAEDIVRRIESTLAAEGRRTL